MGNTISFNNVTQVVETHGEDTPIGPYETTSPLTYENLSGRWSGPEKESGDNTWTVMWSPEGSEGVKFTLVRWLDMSHGQLDTFQHGFNACLKKRLDSPGAMPLGEDPILSEALERIETALG